jgi:hypothetical protein
MCIRHSTYCPKQPALLLRVLARIQLPFTRYLKQCPKRGQESLLEVRGQGVECRVSRVQGCRKAGLGRDEADFLGRKMTYLYPQGLF